MNQKFLRRSAIFLITLLLCGIASIISKPVSVSAATISSSAWYTVVNQGNGKCVDNANGGTANGNVIQQWACSANNVNQQWQFIPTSGGNYEIVTHNAAGMVWDIAGPSTANGALLHLWTYGGGANQQWLPVALDSTHYKFVNLYSGTCLDVPAASTTDGVQLEQYTCNGTAAQSWSLNAIGGAPTATNTTFPNTACPTGTPVPVFVSPVTSPTTATTQVITVNLNFGLSVSVTDEAGTFTSTTPNGSVFTVTVNLVPNSTNHLAVRGTVPNPCGGTSNSLSTTTDTNNQPLNIVQGTAATSTFTPTPLSDPTMVVSPNGSPFSGTPYALPGKVEAENYNTGGEGVAYHDSDAVNSGAQYRTDGVDIEATTDTGGGFDVGWTATGEWLNYTVNVTSSGTYTFDTRVAANTAGSALHLEVDGTNVTGSLAVPATGGWQTWTDVTKSGISLSTGQHVVRLFVDAGGMNINWFSASAGTSATATSTFVPATATPIPTTVSGNGSPFSGTPYSIPGKVEAENYNTGGEGVAYHDSDATNSGTQYRTDGVDIEATTDTGGGFDVGWTATGEWEKYTVNVTSSGTYSVDVRVASAQAGSALHLEVDGANVTGSLTVPNTGGWQTWTEVTKSGISLSAGQHVIRLFIDTAGMNINWFTISSGNFTATPLPTATQSSGNGGGTQQFTYLTSYGYNDNDDGNGHFGTAVIAYPDSLHSIATEGSGTYNDPVTFATDNREIAPQTRIYVPYLQKYFIMEDGCAECTTDWSNGQKWHVDLWMGGNNALQPEPALANCEGSITRNDNIFINAGPGYPVDTTPLFSNGQCTAVIH